MRWRGEKDTGEESEDRKLEGQHQKIVVHSDDSPRPPSAFQYLVPTSLIFGDPGGSDLGRGGVYVCTFLGYGCGPHWCEG